MNITEEEVIKLRNRISDLYGEDGEDLAQDAVVRVLSNQFRKTKYWFEHEILRAKRAWQRKQLQDSLRHAEPVESLVLVGETQRTLEARVECNRLANDSKAVRIFRYVMGQSTESRQRIEQLRREIRKNGGT